MRGFGEDGLEEKIVVENAVPGVLIAEQRCERDGIGAGFAESPDDEGEIFGCKTVPAIRLNHRVFGKSSEHATDIFSCEINKGRHRFFEPDGAFGFMGKLLRDNAEQLSSEAR